MFIPGVIRQQGTPQDYHGDASHDVPVLDEKWLDVILPDGWFGGWRRRRGDDWLRLDRNSRRKRRGKLRKRGSGGVVFGVYQEGPKSWQHRPSPQCSPFRKFKSI